MIVKSLHKYLILSLLLCTSVFSYGQFNVDAVENIPIDDLRTFNWGYYLGSNSYDFKFNYAEEYPENSEGFSDISITKSNGFIVGLIGELRLNNFFDIRFEPGLYSAKRELLFPVSGDNIRSVKSTYINLPVLLKFGAKRIGNWRPFIEAGPSLSYNMSSNQNSPENSDSGTFKLKTLTYNYELGVGIDFYLPYFKFSPSIRGSFGLIDEMIHDGTRYMNNINKLSSRAVFIVLTFE